MSSEKTETLSDEAVSKLDKAIQAAKNRQAARKGDKPFDGVNAKTTKAPKPAADATKTGTKRPRLSDEEKTSREQAKARERAEKKAERDARREATKLERNVNKQPAHMRKVMKAAEKLPPLGQAAMLFLNEAQANLPAAELQAVALHIQHINRVSATQRALGRKIEAGMRVRVIDGDPRFVGLVGTVTKAQRIRCYVEVEGAKKPIYLFTSAVEPVTEEQQAVNEPAA